MRTRFLPLLALPLLLLLAAAPACGDDDDSKDSQNPGSGTSASGPRLSDEQYLAVVCKGTQDFSNALVSQTTVEGIGKSIDDFITALKGVNPPADLGDFHQSLLTYLEDGLSDPTSLAVAPRPQPSDKVRTRLATLQSSVPECEKAKYFSVE